MRVYSISISIIIGSREYTHIDESGLYDIRIEKCFGMIISLNEEEPNDLTLDSNTTDYSELNTSELGEARSIMNPQEMTLLATHLGLFGLQFTARLFVINLFLYLFVCH